jgi:hypothetical protein
MQFPLESRAESGVFMKLLQELLKEKKLNIAFLGVNEENLEQSRVSILEFLGVRA